MEYEVYKRWYEWLMAHHRPKVDLIGALWKSAVVACGRAAAAGIDLLSPLTMRVLSYPEVPPQLAISIPSPKDPPRFRPQCAPCPLLAVYLRTDPEVCMERLKKRARSEEAGVPLVRALNFDDCWLAAVVRCTLMPVLHVLPLPDAVAVFSLCRSPMGLHLRRTTCSHCTSGTRSGSLTTPASMAATFPYW